MAKKSIKKTASAPTTLVMMVLDESSSMSTGRDTTIAGFNRQVEAINAGAQSIGNTYVSLVAFSSAVRKVFVNQNASKLEPLNHENYRPNGCTALYDAIWEGCQILLAHPDIDKEDTAILFNIITDGEENSSRQHNASDIRELKDQLEATGRWTFTLMGPKQGLSEMSQILNFNVGNVTAFDPNSVQDRGLAMNGLVGATTCYMNSRGQGLTSSANFYSEHNEAAGLDLTSQQKPVQMAAPQVQAQRGMSIDTINHLKGSSNPLSVAYGNFMGAVNDAIEKNKSIGGD